MQTLNKRCSLSCGPNTIAWVNCNVSIWFRYTMRNMQCVLKVLTVRRWFHSLNSKILNASCPVDQISYSRSYSISTKQNENIRGNFLFSFTFAPQSWIWSIQLVFLCIVYDLHLMRESKASVLGCRFTIALFFLLIQVSLPLETSDVVCDLCGKCWQPTKYKNSITLQQQYSWTYGHSSIPRHRWIFTVCCIIFFYHFFIIYIRSNFNAQIQITWKW